MGAAYELRLVVEAAREGRIELDESRARDQVAQFFERWVDVYPFAIDVLQELTNDDYAETVTLQYPPHHGTYDVYGHALSDAVARAHRVATRCWYVKLRLYDGLYGEVVFLVSLHPMERGMRRVGGVLRTDQ